MTPLTDEQRTTVAENVGLAKTYVRRTGVPWYDEEDAEQDAALGLIRAARGFKPEKGFAFSTFAMVCIASEVSRERGRREGVNYRRHARGDEFGAAGDYVPPGPIDGTVLDTVPSTDDAERDAVTATMIDTVTARMIAACRDYVDFEIVATMLQSCEIPTAISIARSTHVTRHEAARRIAALTKAARG